MLKNLFFLFALICSLSLSAQDTADCSLGLVLTSAQADAGDNVTIDVTVRQFNDIIAMQYRHEWDPELLTFVEVLYNPALPINASNFNFQPDPLAEGHLNFVFVETSLDGLNLSDNTVLYSLVLQVDDPTNAEVVITNTDDFPIEIVQDEEMVIEDYYILHAGIGPVQAAPNDTYPSITSACVLAQVCNDPDLGSITIAPSGNGDLLAEWSNSGGYSNTGEEITGLNGGSYHLVLTDANGQVAEGDFYVSSVDGPDLTLAVDADACGGAPDGAVTTSVNNGSGNYTYFWNTGATTPDLVDVPAGDYQVTVTDVDAGCSVTGSATVEALSTIEGFFTVTEPSCAEGGDGSLTINIEPGSGTAPFTYLWSDSSTGSTIDNLDAGWFFVEVTDGDNCTRTFSYLLEGIGFDFDAVVTNGDCEENSGSIEILLSSDDYSFVWNNSATTGTITDLATGEYSVTVTDDATGCTATATYNIDNGDLIVAYNVECSEVDGSTLHDVTVVIWNFTDPPYTFEWSTGEVTTGESNSTITVAESGLYNVTITSASGCVTTVEDLVVDCELTGPELYLTPAAANLVIAENFCLTVTTDRFTAINGMQFSMNWDESLIDFTGLDNVVLNNLNPTDFNLNLVDDGMLSLSWLASDLSMGETLPDNSPLFDLCFQVSTETSVITNVDFGTFPTAIEMVNVNNEVLNVTTADAELILNDGTTSGDLTFLVDDATVSIGQQFCVPLRAQSFTNITAHQLALTWDPSALQYTGVQNLNLPFLDATTNFGSLAEAQSDGVLRMLWNHPNLVGVSLASGTTIAEVCFTAVGPEGTYPLDFSTTILPAEAVDGTFNTVPVTTQAGTITVGPSVETPASLRIGSAGVEPGQQVCIPVEAVTFEEIVGMQFSINWDMSLLQYSSMSITEAIPTLSESNFNVQAEDGTLGLAWIGNPLAPTTLVDGEVLFELCFTAQATEAVAGVIFSGSPIAIEFIREDEVIPFVPVNSEITISEDNLVWPGDTNDDGIANNLDLLNIGLGFGSEGALRENASLTWQAQFTPAWAEATPLTEVNYRHLDTNGDGVIDAQDTTALQLNWGLETDGFAPTDTENFLTGVPFYVQADTVPAGATAVLPIVLGSEAENVADAYGLAFTIRYPTEMVIAGSLQIAADGWLGTVNDDLLLMYRDYPAEGRVEVAMVRTDAQERSGAGTIGELIIIMEDVILNGLTEIDVEVVIAIEDVTLISYGEEIIPTLPKPTTTLVEGVTNTDTPVWAAEISVQPNPTTGPLQINAGDLVVEQFRLTNATGRLLWEGKMPDGQLDLEAYPAGIYHLQIQTAQGSIYEKIVKQ